MAFSFEGVFTNFELLTDNRTFEKYTFRTLNKRVLTFICLSFYYT